MKTKNRQTEKKGSLTAVSADSIVVMRAAEMLRARMDADIVMYRRRVHDRRIILQSTLSLCLFAGLLTMLLTRAVPDKRFSYIKTSNITADKEYEYAKTMVFFTDEACI